MRHSNNKVWRFLYKLHRYIGLSSSIILIMLAITGIALNHTDDLKLDSQMIQSEFILDWYGINSPEKIITFATTHHWLSQINQQLYFDHSTFLTTKDNLIGAVESHSFIVIALDNSLLLVSLQGELIEQTPYSGIEKIGLNHQQHLMIKSSAGIKYSDDELLTWHLSPVNNQINWSISSTLPENIDQSIKNRFRSSILPLERVLLDLHSGRFFGLAGVIIVDISGILLIILSATGCSIWLKHKLRKLKRS